MRLRDLKEEEEKEYLRKKDEAEKKSEQDRKKYLLELDILRRKLENGLTTEHIEEIIEKNSRHLEDIFSGKKSSARHDDFHKDRNNSRQGLVRTNRSHMISTEKLNTIMDLIENKLNLTSKDQRDYGFKVLLPEVVAQLYSDIHNISIAEAEQKIDDTLDEETVAQIVGLSISPDDDRGLRRRNR